MGVEGDNTFEHLIEASSTEEVKQVQNVGDEAPFLFFILVELQESLKELYIHTNLLISECSIKQLLRE